jgi:hypothetical protein
MPSVDGRQAGLAGGVGGEAAEGGQDPIDRAGRAEEVDDARPQVRAAAQDGRREPAFAGMLEERGQAIRVAVEGIRVGRVKGRRACRAAGEVAEADRRELGPARRDSLQVVGRGDPVGQVGRQVVVRLDQPPESFGADVLPA